ncbi:hypothetical protein [Borrelia persica]|uniref:hypothetical protein n=1 Tax=Borrelia persica TaxID=44448 RepID=UPI00046617E2|nr:hypothetical protein [Borrelia persica]
MLEKKEGREGKIFRRDRKEGKREIRDNNEIRGGRGKMRIVKQFIIFSLVMVMGCNSGLLAEGKQRMSF